MADNRVELTDRKGPGGTRTARVVHAFAPQSLKVWEQAIALGMKVIKAAGAADPWSNPMASAHMMGGTVMGRDAAGSVADSFGRSHDIANLFIAGPGLFPTAGAMNPNFTNHALTLRSAEHILANWE